MVMIDDVKGVRIRYNLVQIYTDGSYHCNIYGAESLAHAQEVADNISSQKGISILSINEGNYCTD
jgi:hypothetical protein